MTPLQPGGLGGARGEGELLSAVLAERGEGPQHIVQFYERDEELADVVAEFLGAGLLSGDALVVVATPEHRLLIGQRLRERGFDANGAVGRGQLTFLDARDTLHTFMVDGMPSDDRFTIVIGDALQRCARGGVTGRVRAYGEMVDLLWREGNAKAALRLEDLWNDLQSGGLSSLLCAYAMGSLYNQAADVHQICASHTHVLRTQVAPPADGEPSLDATALPPQHARALAAEIAHRTDLERALRGTIKELRQKERELSGTAERTERLMKITAAIADAVTPEQVYAALVDEVAGALGASSAGLWLLAEDTREARLVRSVGYTEERRERIARMPLLAEGRLPVIDAIRERTPIWISSQAELLARYPHLAAVVTPGRSYRISCLPIVVRGTAIGGLGFTFDDVPPGDPEQRDLMLLVARYSGQALERLRLLDLERRSRTEAEVAAARLGLLSRASRAFSEAGYELPRLLQAVAEQVTMAHADACGVMLISDAGDRLEVAAVHHRDPAAVAMVRSIVEMSPLEVGQGVSGRVAASGETLFFPTVNRDALLATAYQPFRSFIERYLPHSLIAIPVRGHGRVLGVLMAMRQVGSSTFCEEDRHLLEELAERAGVAIEGSRLYADNQHGRMRAELLYGLARAVIDARRVEEVFDPALDAIERALDTTRCSILLNDEDGVMRFRAWRGLSDGYRAAVDGHSPWRRDAVDPPPILVPDVAADPAMSGYLPLFRQEKIGSLAFIPLVAGGRLIGKFMVYYDRPQAFSAPRLDMARAIANHVAAACARFASVAQLEQTVRFNEMFAGILGHDLRNPLGAIMASAELALRRDEGGKVGRPLARILSSGQRMARMIDQLLDFTRVRVGAGIPLRARPADLFAVVRQVTDELEPGHPGRLHLQLAGRGEGSFDVDRMSQVFSNLLGNALQHGLPEPGVTIRAQAGDGDDAADRLRVEVHNAGAIPPALLSKLFEPLTGGERRRDGSQGLGLGLYISRQIVEAHGGQLEVRSTEAEGTTFAVLLPRGVGRA